MEDARDEVNSSTMFTASFGSRSAEDVQTNCLTASYLQSLVQVQQSDVLENADFFEISFSEGGVLICCLHCTILYTLELYIIINMSLGGK